ncbi:MAG: hypothetical protein ACXACF_02010 [Candidatus Hermodarchaeia archaeon]|jgi:hypothetical protein
MSLEFTEELVDMGEFQIRVAVSRLTNGTLMLFSDGDHRFGTIAVGVPTPFGELSPTATSVMIGTRFQAEVRAIADIAAQKLGGIVVVNLFLSKEHEAEISGILAAVRQIVLKLELKDEKGPV